MRMACLFLQVAEMSALLSVEMHTVFNAEMSIFILHFFVVIMHTVEMCPPTVLRSIGVQAYKHCMSFAGRKP